MSGLRFVCCLLAFQLIAANDPCDRSNHRVLYDFNSTRSNYTRTGHVATCDRYSREGWYRVISPAGGDMINTCPQERSCSTRFPIWMDGDPPPNDGRNHSRDAFVHAYGDCTADHLSISVRNCTDFNVYYLVRPPSCPTAYCFGHKAPCPPGESSPTGRQPGCTGNFTALTEDPVVDWTVKHRPRSTRLQLVLRCNLSRPEDLPPDTILHVVWFRSRDGVLTNTSRYEIKPNELPHELGERDWPGEELDFGALKNESEFYCKMRAAGARYSSPNPWRHSASLTAGIQVDRFIHVPANAPVAVRLDLRPTMPILNGDLNADVRIPSRHQRTCRPTPRVAGIVMQLQHSTCRATIKAIKKFATWQEEWRNITRNPAHLDIRATYQGQNSGPSTMYIKIRTLESHYPHELWQNFQLPVVTAYVNNNTDSQSFSPGVCHSQYDPYIKTFDGCHYDMHLRGEFVLYRNVRFDTQVNLFTEAVSPGSSVSSNCGLTVRSGENAYTINMCDSHRQRIGFINCTNRALTVERRGSDYVVTLATGTTVSISNINSRIIRRIAITASPHDFHQTEGLCGRHNGNPNDDFYAPGATRPNPPRCQRNVNTFAETWRVPQGSAQSLWNGYQGPRLQDRPRFCKCGNKPNEVMCSPGNLRERCTNWGPDVTGQQLARCPPPQQRSTSSGSDYSDMTAPPFNFTKDPPPTPPEWSNGWNETSARTHCQQSIMNTPAGRQCSRLAHMDFSSHVDDCVRDIRATGGTEWVSAGVGGLIDQCNNEVQRNVTTWDDDGETARPPAAITRTLCPSNCHNRGQCVDSLCQCNPGYGSSDCSIDLNQPPKITGVPNDGKCDSRQRPCQATPLTGTNFVNSKNLTCKILYSNIAGRGEGPVTGSADVQATLMHDAEIMCPFHRSRMSYSTQTANDNPRGQVYRITVSNNGVNYSREVMVVKYDGKCVDCDPRALTCGIKSQTCHISGGCYIHRERSPTDPCSTCQPSNDNRQWTTPTVPSCRIEGNCYQRGRQKPGDTCLSCDPPANMTYWTLKDGHCHINSRCVKAGETNPTNETQVCDPKSNKYGWTPRSTQAGRPPRGRNPAGIIVVLTVLGSVAVVGVITTGAAAYMRKRKRKIGPAADPDPSVNEKQ